MSLIIPIMPLIKMPTSLDDVNVHQTLKLMLILGLLQDLEPHFLQGSVQFQQV